MNNLKPIYVYRTCLFTWVFSKKELDDFEQCPTCGDSEYSYQFEFYTKKEFIDKYVECFVCFGYDIKSISNETIAEAKAKAIEIWETEIKTNKELFNLVKRNEQGIL